MSRLKPPNHDHVHMSLGEHLDELRRRIILALIGMGVALAVTLYYGQDIVAFLSEPLNRAQREAGLVPQTIVHGVTTGFTIYIKTALVAALILASPWAIYHAWKFVAAGLYHHERKFVYLLAPLSTAMTALGLLFTYNVLLPICLAFLIAFATGYGPPGGEKPGLFDSLSRISARSAGGSHRDRTDPPPPDAADAPGEMLLIVPRLDEDPAAPADGQMWIRTPDNVLKVRVGGRTLVAYLAVSSLVNPWLELGAYVNFVLLMTLGVVIAFQLPVVMLLAGMSRLVDRAWLARYRRHSLFVCAALGAVLTPADPLSMVILGTLLYGLFEFGLLLMRLTQRSAPTDQADEPEPLS